MIELLLLITSNVCKKLLGKVFFIHGCYIAIQSGELKSYLKRLAIVNDVALNVKGKYLLDQRLSKNQVFGSPLMTVSAAIQLSKSEPAGLKWKKRINKLDADHFEKAYESYRKQITEAYTNLQK